MLLNSILHRLHRWYPLCKSTFLEAKGSHSSEAKSGSWSVSHHWFCTKCPVYLKGKFIPEFAFFGSACRWNRILHRSVSGTHCSFRMRQCGSSLLRRSLCSSCGLAVHALVCPQQAVSVSVLSGRVRKNKAESAVIWNPAMSRFSDSESRSTKEFC